MTNLHDQIDLNSTPAMPEPFVDTSTTPVTAEPIPSTDTISDDNISVEEFKVNGDSLVTRFKELIHQGNIRRIIIKNEEDHTLLEIPMTIGVVGGVVGAAVFPVIAALGVIGAMVARLTLVIERKV